MRRNTTISWRKVQGLDIKLSDFKVDGATASLMMENIINSHKQLFDSLVNKEMMIRIYPKSKNGGNGPDIQLRFTSYRFIVKYDNDDNPIFGDYFGTSYEYDGFNDVYYYGCMSTDENDTLYIKCSDANSLSYLFNNDTMTIDLYVLE